MSQPVPQVRIGPTDHGMTSTGEQIVNRFYREQQFHALMTENGVLPDDPERTAEMAVRLR